MSIVIEYEEALALKYIGFDLACDYYYTSASTNPTKWYKFPENWNNTATQISAPAYSQVFQWFTTVHKIHGFVRVNANGLFFHEVWLKLNSGQWTRVVTGKSKEADLDLANANCLKELISIYNETTEDVE